jgi:hypothetical protein
VLSGGAACCRVVDCNAASMWTGWSTELFFDMLNVPARQQSARVLTWLTKSSFRNPAHEELYFRNSGSPVTLSDAGLEPLTSRTTGSNLRPGALHYH